MASTGEVWRLGRRPALDGLRGVAVLLVVVSHSFIGTHWAVFGGAVGVTLFFVLSGYLITGLLIPDAGGGTLRLSRFYARRARRLLPALAVLLPSVCALLWLLRDPFLRVYPYEAGVSLLYVRNLVHFDRGLGFDGVLGHMWSLSVEEQFYLIWPSLLVTVFTVAGWLRLRASRVVAALLALGLAWRLAETIAPFGPTPHLRLDTNAVALLAGALVAVTESEGRLLGTPRLAVAGLASVLVLANWPVLTYQLQMVLVLVVVAAAVPLVSRAGDSIGWLTHPSLRWFGKISYGWYLWHVPLICIWINGHPPSMLHRWLASVIALGVAALSYRFIEQPFLRSPLRRTKVGQLDIERRIGSVDSHGPTRDSSESNHSESGGDITGGQCVPLR